MIPVDNSIAGRVADIHHLLPESGLHIVGEHFLPIHFSLMGVPGATLESVRTVRSHVHALGQCRRIVREHGWAAVVADDTAGSAREVADLGDPSVAALAPAPRPASTTCSCSPRTSRTSTTTRPASWSWLATRTCPTSARRR
jgi:prephenate dehydratase